MKLLLLSSACVVVLTLVLFCSEVEGQWRRRWSFWRSSRRGSSRTSWSTGRGRSSSSSSSSSESRDSGFGIRRWWNRRCDSLRACQLADADGAVLDTRDCSRDSRSSSSEEQTTGTPAPEPTCDIDIPVLISARNGMGEVLDSTVFFCTDFNISALLEEAGKNTCESDDECLFYFDTCSFSVAIDSQTFTYCGRPNKEPDFDSLGDLRQLIKGGWRIPKRRTKPTTASTATMTTTTATTTTTPAPIIP